MHDGILKYGKRRKQSFPFLRLPVILRAPNKEFFFARPTKNFFSFSSPPFESDWGRGSQFVRLFGKASNIYYSNQIA
jgi:hypothetical protein